MRGIRSKKIFYRPSGSWYNPVICCYKWKFFWSILFLNKSQRSHLFVLHIIKKTFSTGQKPVLTVKIMISEQVNLASAFFLLWTSFCFLQVYQQKRVGNWQKQPAEMFCKKSYSRKFRCIHRKTPVLESLFHKVADLQPLNFIKKRTNTGVFLFLFLFRNINFEEHLRKAASELALRSDCLELCFWAISLETTLTCKYYKNTSCFQTRALNTIRRICHQYI